MKLIKTFGFAAVAAIAAMAFLGASSAMAESTQLCSHNEAPCAAGNVISHVHFVDPDAILETNVLTVECESLFLGDSLGLAAPLVIHGNFTYSNCSSGCTATQTSTSALIEVLKEGAGGSVKGTAEVNVHCGSLINCTYNGVGLKGTAVNANLPATAGETVIEGQEVKKTGGIFCPSTGTLTTHAESLTDLFLTT